MIGHDWRVESIVDPSAQPGAEPRTPSPARPPPEPPAARSTGRRGRRRGRTGAAPESAAPRRPSAPSTRRAMAARPRRDPGHPRRRVTRASDRPDVTDEDADRDDPDADDHSLGGAQLLERELGASIIEEIKHD